MAAPWQAVVPLVARPPAATTNQPPRQSRRRADSEHASAGFHQSPLASFAVWRLEKVVGGVAVASLATLPRHRWPLESILWLPPGCARASVADFGFLQGLLGQLRCRVDDHILDTGHHLAQSAGPRSRPCRRTSPGSLRGEGPAGLAPALGRWSVDRAMRRSANSSSSMASARARSAPRTRSPHPSTGSVSCR